MMDNKPQSMLAEVKCYSLDSRGCCYELTEYNFDAELDFRVPIGRSLSTCANPELEFSETSSNFKCYPANFLGDSFELKQRPLDIKYIEDSLKEDRIAVIYLCKEEYNDIELVATEDRKRLASSAKPSEVAEDFIQRSVSGYESGYCTDTQRKSSSNASATPRSSSTKSFSSAEEMQEDEDLMTLSLPSSHSPIQSHSPRWKDRKVIRRQVTIWPRSPSPRPPLIKNNTVPSLPSPSSQNPPPALGNEEGDSVFGSHSLPRIMQPNLAPPKLRYRSTSPNIFSRKNKKRNSLGPAVTGPNISSPVSLPSDPVVTLRNIPRLTRTNATKRRTILHIVPDTELEHDMSTTPLCVRLHFTDRHLQLNADSSNSLPLQQTTEFHIKILNYMTVGQLKKCISEQIKEHTSIALSSSSTPLILYYTSVRGDVYELLNNSQFLCHTFLYKELASQLVTSPLLECKIGSRLPDRELRVLFRINQLTGVRLQDDITTTGVDTSSLTVLPECDQQEVQFARRSLHSFMLEVVEERDEVEYSGPRDISSREASMQLSMMTPADNKIPITFHYETTFSLRKNLSIHTYADTALALLFPALVSCGLVSDRMKDYTLQVTGEENYIYGDIELIAFRHIRKCIVKSEDIHLSVTEKKPIEIERPHKFSIMPLDPLSNVPMDHSDLSGLYPIFREGVSSSWETENKLRLMRVDVENFPQVSSRSSRQVRVSLKLLHGSKPLLPHSPPLMMSGKVDYDVQCLSWSNHPLEFDIKIKDIPKAARILVTMEERKSRHSGPGEKNQMYYWGMISVFDFSGRLRSGEAELRLWKGEENRKTGDMVVPLNLATHPSNNPQPTAVTVTLSFDAIQPSPVVYPSTRERSRSSFTKQHTSVSNVTCREGFKHIVDTIKNDKLYKKVPDYVLASSDLVMMLEQFYVINELKENIADVPDYIALKLLDSDFPEEHVRAFAVRALENLSDEQLEDYLLQLVQALKFEAHHDSHLARFLLRKALTNKTIGHFFFWYLKSEMHNRLHTARFAVILETYLKGCGESLLTKFTDQVDIQNSLCDMASKMRRECESGTDLESMQYLLPIYLKQMEIQRCHFIPVHNPRQVLGKLNPKKCKVMSSKKRPMWLEMYNIHPSALRQSPVRLILKLGDDLRQDMITLRMFSLFEKLWEEQGLDLELIPYGCMATGPQTGFIEVVKNARTIKEVSSVNNSTKLLEWIKSHQTNEFGEIDKEMVDTALRRFTRSCAGYSVATYVLGIGDRHNDNIMVTTSGNLFHIDFGHFLGHIKYFMGFKREWAPFVLTPDFVYVMGGENSDMFETYKNLCCKAFLTLRRNADLIINLFSLMRSTGIPELTCVEDTDYIRNVLELDTATSEHDADMRFRKVIQKCLNLKWTVQIMWRIHILNKGSE